MLRQLKEKMELTTEEFIAKIDGAKAIITKTQRPYNKTNAKAQVAQILALANSPVCDDDDYVIPTFGADQLCFARETKDSDVNEVYDGQHRGMGCKEFSENKWSLPKSSDIPFVDAYLKKLQERLDKKLIRFNDLSEEEQSNFLNFVFTATVYVSEDKDERSTLLLAVNSGRPLSTVDKTNNKYAYNLVMDRYQQLAAAMKEDSNKLAKAGKQPIEFNYPEFLKPADYPNYEKACRMFIESSKGIENALFRMTMRRWKADTSKGFTAEFYDRHLDDKVSERALDNTISRTLNAMAYATEILPDNMLELGVANAAFCYWVAGAENAADDRYRRLGFANDRTLRKVKEEFGKNILKWYDHDPNGVTKEKFVLNGVACPVEITGNKYNYLSNTAYKWERTNIFAQVLDFIYNETVKGVI